MKKIILVLAFCVFGALLCAQERVAVLPFTGGAESEGDVIAHLLGTELAKLGGFDIVSRTQAIDTVMEEYDFERGGLTDGDTIVAFGKDVNAKYVVSGNIQKLGDRKMILASILDVETFQQVAGDYHEYDQLEDVLDYLPQIAEKLVNRIKKDYTNIPTLGILPFDGVDESNADVLAQLLAIELSNSGKYMVISRTSTIRKAMEEQNIQRSGLTDASTASKLGEVIPVEYVLAGNVLSLGSTDLMNITIVEVLTLVQKGGAYTKYKTIEEGIDFMAELSYELTGVKSEIGTAEGELAVGLIESVLVKAGSFDMGSNEGDSDEKPVHRVTLTKNYYMGSYEVTQKQWYEVMGSKPSSNAPSSGWENLPVEQVSWYEAIEFCNGLSKQEGLEPYYGVNGDNVRISDENGKGYRLPTEAEWEYAARGGKDGDHSLEYSGSNSVGRVAWYEENSGGETQEVGTKQANSLGLYDMSGNVWEWCWDWYGEYSSSSTRDPTGASGGSFRIYRGGSCYSSAYNARVANRGTNFAKSREDNIGFRVVRFQ